VRGDAGAGIDVEQHDVVRGRRLGREPGAGVDDLHVEPQPVRGQPAAHQLDQRAVELHDPLHRAGTGGGDVAGQRPRPAAEVQDAQRGRRRRGERVEQVAGPADVLELQMRGVGEVDVALRGVVDQQRPGRGAVRVGHQLGPPVAHLDPDDRRGEPASSCVVHRGILPRTDGDVHRARERVTRVTRARNTAFLA
jgi:hypothetical protein